MWIQLLTYKMCWLQNDVYYLKSDIVHHISNVSIISSASALQSTMFKNLWRVDFSFSFLLLQAPRANVGAYHLSSHFPGLGKRFVSREKAAVTQRVKVAWSSQEPTVTSRKEYSFFFCSKKQDNRKAPRSLLPALVWSNNISVCPVSLGFEILNWGRGLKDSLFSFWL